MMKTQWMSNKIYWSKKNNNEKKYLIVETSFDCTQTLK